MEFERNVKRPSHLLAAVTGMWVELLLVNASGPQTFGKTAAEVIILAAASGHMSYGMRAIIIEEERFNADPETNTQFSVQTVDNAPVYAADIASYGQQGSNPVD